MLNLKSKIWNWIRRYVLRRKERGMILVPVTDSYLDLQRRLHPQLRPVKKPRKAIHQDIGRFMKHGRQSAYYRRTVKAKIQPKEDD